MENYDYIVGERKNKEGGKMKLYFVDWAEPDFIAVFADAEKAVNEANRNDAQVYIREILDDEDNTEATDTP